MKRILFVIAALAFLFSMNAKAQVICETKQVLIAKTVTTTTDSTGIGLPIRYNSASITQIYNQTPDSIRLAWYGLGGTTGDSVGMIFKYFTRLVSPYNAVAKYGVSNATSLDSITAQATGIHLIPASAWTGNTYLDVYAVPITTGHNNAASTSAYPAKLWLNVQYFYHVAR